MMKIYFYLVFFPIFFGINGSFAQNLSDDNTLLINNYFQSQSGLDFTNTTSSNIEQNTEIDITVIQNGNYNTSYIVSNSNNKQKVNQQGNYNNYEYYSYYNTDPTEMNTLQYGENNSVQIFGQNELTKNMTIIQNTNDKTLIIKNY